MWGQMGPSKNEWMVIFLLAGVGLLAAVALIVSGVIWIVMHLAWV